MSIDGAILAAGVRSLRYPSSPSWRTPNPWAATMMDARCVIFGCHDGRGAAAAKPKPRQRNQFLNRHAATPPRRPRGRHAAHDFTIGTAATRLMGRISAQIGFTQDPGGVGDYPSSRLDRRAIAARYAVPSH